MKFEFEIEVEETKGAINTAAVISEKLKTAKITFSTVNKTGVPAIWAQFEGNKEKTFIAALCHRLIEDFDETCAKKDGWFLAYSKCPNGQGCNGHKSYIFPYLTDSAQELVTNWKMQLCGEYEMRLEADKLQVA